MPILLAFHTRARARKMMLALTPDAPYELYDDAVDTSTTRDTPVILCCADSVPRLSVDHQMVVVDEVAAARVVRPAWS